MGLCHRLDQLAAFQVCEVLDKEVLEEAPSEGLAAGNRIKRRSQVRSRFNS